jgi:hypothetical protein
VAEEKTQIFRGDEPPEEAIADTSEVVRRKPLSAPVDQRGIRDQKDGESFDRSIRDASGGPGDQRRMEDADGLSELRQLHGKDGREGGPTLRDSDGPSDLRQLQDADHDLEGTRLRSGDGPSDARRMEDADGLSDQRAMQDADGLSDLRAMKDAEGLSDLRQMNDQHALIPEGAVGDENLGAEGDSAAAQHATGDAEDEALPDVMSDPDLTFVVEEEAAPWALSIHLEERIASLGVSTKKVNQQLDRLDESIQRLAKRIAR